MSAKNSLMKPQTGRALSEIVAAKGAAVVLTAENVAYCISLSSTSRSQQPYRTQELAGVGYASRGQHPKAIEAYSNAIAASPFWAAPYIHWKRGDSYAAMGQYEDAIADYEVPHCDDVCIEDETKRRWRLVALLQKAQQPERAIRALRELIDHCTSMLETRRGGWNYFYDRALAWAELKEYAKALDDCRLASDASLVREKTLTPVQRAIGTTWKPSDFDVNELRAAILAEIM